MTNHGWGWDGPEDGKSFVTLLRQESMKRVLSWDVSFLPDVLDGVPPGTIANAEQSTAVEH